MREQSAARATLACDYEPYSLELVAASAEHRSASHTAPGSCADRCRSIRPGSTCGPPRRPSRITAGNLSLSDNEGFEHHLLPFAPEDDSRPAIARTTSELPAMRPRKLGHVNRLTADLQASTRFYTEVLGMEIADYLGDAGIWLHVNSEHHQLALVDAGRAEFHHLAFDYYDFGTLRSLFDNLAQHGRWLAWGPVRHGIAQNICGYVRITDEPLLVECYVDMEVLEPDHEPRRWLDDRFSSNTWGPLPPRSYFRFDAAAIESERESLETRGIPLAPLAD